MRVARFRRSLSRKTPYILFGSFFIFGLIAIIFFLMQFILSKEGAFISPLSIGKSSSQNDLQNLLYKNNIPFSKIQTATDSSYMVFLKDQGEVDLNPSKNITSQISSLQLILKRLTIEGKKFKRLDLRYALPIIEF